MSTPIIVCAGTAHSGISASFVSSCSFCDVCTRLSAVCTTNVNRSTSRPCAVGCVSCFSPPARYTKHFSFLRAFDASSHPGGSVASGHGTWLASANAFCPESTWYHSVSRPYRCTKRYFWYALPLLLLLPSGTLRQSTRQSLKKSRDAGTS